MVLRRGSCVLLVDKPPGVSSREASRLASEDLRGRMLRGAGERESKIGHLGTLDPAASGLLPVLLGQCTRLAQFIPAEPKTYLADINLGVATTTGDGEGEVVERRDVGIEMQNNLGQIKLEECARKFLGKTQQRPNIFSAIRIDGIRAYELARSKKITQELMPLREIMIHKLSLNWSQTLQGIIHLSVTCDSGLFVRTLAEDIAKELGTIAHASNIRRMVVGPFRLDSMTFIKTETILYKTLDLFQVLDLIPAKKVTMTEKEEQKWLNRPNQQPGTFLVYRPSSSTPCSIACKSISQPLRYLQLQPEAIF